MSKSQHTEAQMIGALKQMEAGRKAEDVAREIGVSKHTLYAWKAKYGGMTVSEAQEAKQLREENTKLKKRRRRAGCGRGMQRVSAGSAGWWEWRYRVTATRRSMAMKRCVCSWWSWGERSHASGIGGCTCCSHEAENG